MRETKDKCYPCYPQWSSVFQTSCRGYSAVQFTSLHTLPTFKRPTTPISPSLYHGADSSQRLTDIASTHSSAVANAVATVTQIFLPSTNFSRSVTTACFTKSVVTLGHSLHYLLPPPTTKASQHYNLCCTSTHNAGATLGIQSTFSPYSWPWRTDHLTDGNFITRLLYKDCYWTFILMSLFTLYFTRLISTVTAMRFVIVDFKEMNEWMSIGWMNFVNKLHFDRDEIKYCICSCES